MFRAKSVHVLMPVRMLHIGSIAKHIAPTSWTWNTNIHATCQPPDQNACGRARIGMAAHYFPVCRRCLSPNQDAQPTLLKARGGTFGRRRAAWRRNGPMHGEITATVPHDGGDGESDPGTR